MIAIGSDHGGYELKEFLKSRLEENNLDYKDVGCYSLDEVDYPKISEKAAQLVADGKCEKGIVICGTGIGVSIAANKVTGIRCALCSDCFSAEMAKEHNNANMIALGARVIGPELAWKIVESYLGAEFLGGKHARRVEEIMTIEQKNH